MTHLRRSITVIIAVLLLLIVGLLISSNGLRQMIAILGILLCGGLGILLVQDIRHTQQPRITEKHVLDAAQRGELIKRTLRMLTGVAVGYLLIPFLLVVLRDIFALTRNVIFVTVTVLTSSIGILLAFYSEWVFRRKR